MKLLAALAFSLVPSVAGAAGGIGKPATATVKPVDRCSTVMACHRALRWQRHDRRHLERLLRVRFRRDVSSAITFTAQAFSIDAAKMTRVAYCESRLDPFAANGQYLGLFQLGSFARSKYLRGAWSDPYANAIAAASYERDAGGWGPWSCGGA